MDRIWEIQPREGRIAYTHFEVYRDLGEERSLAKVAAIRGRKPVSIEVLCAKYRWVSRCAAYDEHMARVRLQAREAAERKAALKDHLNRTRSAGRKLNEVGGDLLELAHRSIKAYKELPAEAVQPQEQAALVRTAIAAISTGLDAEAHGLGVDRAIALMEQEEEGG